MADEEAYGAAAKVYALYGALFNKVVKELGEGKALALHKNAHEYIGLKTGKQLRDQIGDIEYNLETLTTVLQKGNRGIGIDYQMVKGENSLLLRNLRCARARALKSARAYDHRQKYPFVSMAFMTRGE